MTATLARDARAEARAALASASSTLTQLMRAIALLDQEPAERAVRIGISASATVDLLGTYLRRHGLLAGTRVEVVSGNYDDPIGDVERFLEAGVRHLVLLPHFDALLPSFEAQLATLTPEAVDAVEDRLRTRLRLTFERAADLDSVVVGTFSRMSRPAALDGRDAVATVLERFDAVLREEAGRHASVRLVDTADVIATVGRGAAFDDRFYYRSKAPYTGVFLDELARRITAGARGFGGRYLKVLALDCDNTLWGGVVGEDSLAGIHLGPHDSPGNVFWQVQHRLAALRRSGALLCLVTKNNPDDVAEVLRAHPHAVLREADFVTMRVDWTDKPTNLRAIADELGVGLDSMVFLDDSSFECEAVRQQLPMVTTLQVPAALSEYPRLVQEIEELFLAGGSTDDGADKTEQYRRRARARDLQDAAVDHESYLASLHLTVELRRDLEADAARVSELSQKSNQFNLTTRRYGVAEIQRSMADPACAVYGLLVGDVFGSAGLTGAAVVRHEGRRAHVESFFLSCRVLGRGIETAVWPQIVADARAAGCTELTAEFLPSAKNAQVADFYDRLGFALLSEGAAGARTYRIDTVDFPTPPPAWIEMSSVG